VDQLLCGSVVLRSIELLVEVVARFLAIVRERFVHRLSTFLDVRQHGQTGTLLDIIVIVLLASMSV